MSTWTFPKRKKFFLRIEKVFILILSVLLFFYLISASKSYLYSLIYVVLFIIIYFIISYIIFILRDVDEDYVLTSKHLEIKKRLRNRFNNEKIPLHTIKRHKVDHRFLGGYVITHNNKKRVLYFNNVGEAKLFDEMIKKHTVIKKPKKVSKSKKVVKPKKTTIKKKPIVKKKTIRAKKKR
jgi:hypothetical protein